MRKPVSGVCDQVRLKWPTQLQRLASLEIFNIATVTVEGTLFMEQTQADLHFCCLTTI